MDYCIYRRGVLKISSVSILVRKDYSKMRKCYLIYYLTLSLIMSSLSASSSHTLPTPSLSSSSCPEFGVKTQLSYTNNWSVVITVILCNISNIRASSWDLDLFSARSCPMTLEIANMTYVALQYRPHTIGYIWQMSLSIYTCHIWPAWYEEILYMK